MHVDARAAPGLDRPSRPQRDGATPIRAVIGIPLYNGEHGGHLSSALSSLLAQTYGQVAFVVVDDASSDATFEIVAQATAGDPRVVLRRNPSRLGLVGNWRRVFDVAAELFPDAEYFAWASDHDLWDSRWLDHVVAQLDAAPGAVLAYTHFSSVDEHGRTTEIVGGRAGIDTGGLTRRERFDAATSYKIGAGSLIYGLFRRSALTRVGGYPLIYRPDIYVLVELSLYGEFRRVPEMLWQRRFWSPEVNDRRHAAPHALPPQRNGWRAVGRAALERLGVSAVSRQHRHTFPGRVPLYSRLPVGVQHTTLLVWRLVVLGRGRPLVGRAEGALYSLRLAASAWRNRRMRTRKEERSHVRREREIRWAAKREVRRAARRRDAKPAGKD